MGFEGARDGVEGYAPSTCFTEMDQAEGGQLRSFVTDVVAATDRSGRATSGRGLRPGLQATYRVVRGWQRGGIVTAVRSLG